MKKTLLLLFQIILVARLSKAQDFKFGTFLQDELNMKNYDKDTSAHAVVLLEYGRAQIQPVDDDNVDLGFEYHVKIKIFDKSGYDQGNVEIPYYSLDGLTFEQVQGIKAITTYKDEDGMIKTVELDPKKIYNQVEDKHHSKFKFTMPGMRDGCIIEYSYKLISPWIDEFHPWEFQSDIPKIYSEYDIHIPGYWNYKISKTGVLALTKNTSELETGCFSFHGNNASCSHLIYGMSNIPAFIVEDDMTSPKNYLSAIRFQLCDYYSMMNGANMKVSKEWKDVDYELKHSDSFGGQLKRTGLLKDRITPIIAGETDDLQKAKTIYDYIKKTIKWNEVRGIGSADGIRRALLDHTGDVADVNLALTTALNAAGLNTDAVLLSTRNNGLINRLYPVINDFDYVIAKVNIGDKSYLLDATDPLLPFGMLPLRCINDQGRVMSLDKPSYWIDMNTPQKRNITYHLDLTLQADGKIKGTMSRYSVGYEAYLKRKEIKKFNSIDEYIEDITNKSADFKILKSEVSGVDSLDAPISETYEVEIKEFKNLNHDHLGFNPYIINRLVTNPYKLAERDYPVDIGMPLTIRYSLSMHLPDGYMIENAPKNTSLTLPLSGGLFMTDYQAEDTGTGFTFAHVIQLNKSVYQPNEYPYLKEFYNQVILSEKNEIAFKKK
jgi:hypothetical protein